MAKRGAADGGDLANKMDELLDLGGQILQALISLAGIGAATSSLASSTGTIASTATEGGGAASVGGKRTGAVSEALDLAGKMGTAGLAGAGAGVALTEAVGGFAALRTSLMGGSGAAQQGAALSTLAGNLPSSIFSRTQMGESASQAAYGDVAGFAAGAAQLGQRLSRDELRPFFERRLEIRNIEQENLKQLGFVQNETTRGQTLGNAAADLAAFSDALNNAKVALELLPLAAKAAAGGLGSR